MIKIIFYEVVGFKRKKEELKIVVNIISLLDVLYLNGKIEW